MGFKEMVEKDIENIFLNDAEFGSIHQFNGRDILCVIDEEKFQNKLKNGLITQEEGTFQRGFTLFVGKNHLKLQPHPLEEITIDGEEYTVILSKMDMGLYEIDLVKFEEI